VKVKIPSFRPFPRLYDSQAHSIPRDGRTFLPRSFRFSDELSSSNSRTAQAKLSRAIDSRKSSEVLFFFVGFFCFFWVGFVGFGFFFLVRPASRHFLSAGQILRALLEFDVLSCCLTCSLTPPLDSSVAPVQLLTSPSP